jgi:Fic family protein
MKGTQKNINQELEAIKTALGQFKDGASLEDIKAISGLDIALRSLQRRLERLHEQGQITLSGKTRSTLYHLVRDSGEREGKAQPDKSLVPLTTGGRKILTMISRPKQQRSPVDYNRYFLQLYRPNIDSYLTADEKIKLAEIGKTARFDQPPGTYARETLNRLVIDLSWNSSRLEGNSYTLLDTERLISLGEPDDSKSAAEAQMILNHKDAVEFIAQAANGIGFNRYTILNLHALLSNNLLPDPAAAGRLRTLRAGIHQSVYTPLAIPQQIEEMFSLMLEKAEHIKDPFEQAFFIMVQLPYLQPFDNINKRVARLAANIPLNRQNLAPLSFIDVPNDIYTQGMIGVYELNRFELLKDVFLWAYERSSLRYTSLRQSLGEPDPFRLKHREAIRTLITEIVSGSLSHKEAAVILKSKATQLPENDQSKFIESVETELITLHEGNFARYWISPTEFRRWKEIWAKSKTH